MKKIIYSSIIALSLLGLSNIVNADVYTDFADVTTEQLERTVDYCYSHATNPNPVQDLIDAGLLPTTLTGYSCNVFESMKSVKEADQKAGEFMRELVEAD